MQVILERFFDRYALPQSTADLRFLAQLSRAYSKLPYENVTKILKETRSSSSTEKLRRTGEVLEDHLRWTTGGTCFSLCNALQEILRHCGYDAFIAMADMHYGKNIHCAIIVRLAGARYLLDPGYLLHEPVLLSETQISHETAMNTVILRNEGNETYSLSTKETGAQKWRYRLRAIPVSPEEFEAHWIHSFSLNSMEHIMLTRLQEAGRLYYRKDRIELVRPQQRLQQKVSKDDVGTLANLFGLPADLILQAQRVLAR
ncbi:arylamine N-acetyltransferase [bacterium]|nr:arylamine N-acetyltransferase [bacterium]